MCNILIFKAGQMPLERSEFNNMCWNNWHSYGIVTAVDGRLDVHRVVPSSGEIDPEEIWQRLLEDRQYPRYLHVRHNTAGTTSLENCHPFPVLYQERKGKTPKQVEFMHNGTLYEYRSMKTEGTQSVPDNNGPSDTQNFVNQVLIPYTAAMDFGGGKGDIQNYNYQRLIRRFWPAASGNRGLLISSDQDPFIIGDWKKMKAADGSDILSSNDDYFDKLVRGPRKDRLEAEEKEKQKTAPFLGSYSTGTSVQSSKLPSGVTPFTAFDFSKDRKHGVFSLTTSFSNVTDDWNVWDRETAVNLGLATVDELKELYRGGEKDMVILCDYIFSDYYQLYQEFVEVKGKHEAASKRISALQGELNELRKWATDNGLFKDKKVQNG